MKLALLSPPTGSYSQAVFSNGTYSAFLHQRTLLRLQSRTLTATVINFGALGWALCPHLAALYLEFCFICFFFKSSVT